MKTNKKLLFMLMTLGFICFTSQAFTASYTSASKIEQTMKNKNISINMQNQTLKKIMSEIHTQSGIDYGYQTNGNIDIFKRFSLKVENVSVDKALQTLFSGSNYTFSTINDKIVIELQKPIQSAQEQQKTIVAKGVVVDKAGKSIPDVVVSIKGRPGFGTVSNNEGHFEIAVSDGDILQFSFIGMNTQTYKFNATLKKEIKIVMTEATEQMDDVVVTGIFRKSASSFTGSEATYTAQDIKQFSSRNLINTLKNLDPAFNIVENNDFGSDPNHLPEVEIRGTSSMPNIGQLQDNSRAELNTPLIIIDGFESNLETMMDMNENEVATIVILKDASATAMYGSRGANGVIVIETKIPQQGKLKVNYRGEAVFEVPDLSSYNLMNAKEKLELEYVAGIYNDDDDASKDLLLKSQYNYLLSKVNSGVTTDWLSKPLRTGIGQKHNVRLEGGDQTFRYSAAINYNLVKGVMKKSERKNFQGYITLTYRYKKLRFNNNTIIGLNYTKDSPWGAFNNYATMNPYFAPYDNQGNFVKTFGLDGPGANLRWGSGIANPMWNSTLNTYNNTNTTSITNNFSIDVDATESLKLTGRFGVTRYIGGGDTFYPAEHTNFSNYSVEDKLRRGQYTERHNTSNSMDGAFNVSFNHTFNDVHMVYASAHLNIRQTDYKSSTLVGEGFPNENMDFISMALQYPNGSKPTGSESRQRSVGVIGNANYSYNDKYYVDFTATTDGNSAFGTNKRFAGFWSAGIGWNIHKEAFLLDNEIINKLKIRASVGTNGSQAFNSYQALSTYKYYSDTRYGQWIGASVSSLGNPDLKWQQKFNKNFGIETELLNKRIQIVFDTYIETTKDQISSIEVPSSTGFTSYIENIGKVENKGFELRLTGNIIRNTDKRIQWSVTGSMAHNRNKIKTISQAMKDAQSSIMATQDINPYIIYQEGYSMNAIWVVPSLGIDPSTGLELYRTKDGGITTKWDAANLEACGVAQPKYYGNLNTTFRWKGLLYTASFGYRFGGQLYNYTLISKVENVNYNYNVDKRVYNDRWQKPGDKTYFKSIFDKSSTQKSSRFVMDEKTFRCQSMNLTYEFDKEYLKKHLGIQLLSLSLYTSDVFYISSVKRERGTSYPFSRNFTFTLNATF